MRLVVNIPTYCERDNIEEIIKRVLSTCKKIDADVHVLVADSASPDGTGDIVKKVSRVNPKVHYLNVKVRGLGVGVVKGHRFAVDKLKADVLAQMDGDLSHEPSTLPIMFDYIKKGYDLVKRFALNAGGKNLLGWHRRLFTRGSALFCKLSWGTFNLSEYTNSYRMFTKELFEKIDFTKVPWRAKTYIIQPAFLYASVEAGAKIKEVPIKFVDRKKGYSKAQIVAYTFDVLKFGVKVRIQRSKMFVKFLMVGTGGYLTNAIALGLLNRGQVYSFVVLSQPVLSFIPQHQEATRFLFLTLDRLFVASVISIELSIIFNFLFHDNWTFKTRKKDGLLITRFLKFNLTSAGSPIIQLISILVAFRIFSLHEQIGLVIGVGVGLFVNYLANTLWIWKAYPVSQAS